MLTLIVIVLAVVAFRLWKDVGALRSDLEAVRLSARTDGGAAERIDQLERRVAMFEAALPSSATIVLEPTPAAEPVPVAAPDPPPAEETLQPLEETVLPAIVLVEVVAPVLPTAAPLQSSEPTLPTAATPRESARPETPPPAPAAPSEAWEVVVGTSWLNKIGVVVFIVGVALLLGYSMAHVGPLGRVAMGYALSFAMLGTGVVLERRETYRNYAYGLMGGGWAGTYFTTYAMHALPAALVVHSDLVGSASLVLAAAGMVAHSLRYQSQTLTALAYVAAYAPLTFSPLSMFSLVATVPLTASLLAVASRFAWSGVGILGLASTYGIFVLRTEMMASIPGGTAIAVLWAYWLMFEIGDIAGRRRLPDGREAAPLFVLNAAGFLGAILLQTRGDEGGWGVIGTVATAYAANALLRNWLVGRTSERPEAVLAGPVTTVHAATAIAAAMFAYAIDLRFAGTRQTVALLLETEILVAAGIALADRHVRAIGTAAAVLTTLHLFAALLLLAPTTGFETVIAASPVALLVAVVWHGNREWLRRRGLALDAVEHLYTWVALAAIVIVVRREVPSFYQGVAGLGWALILLEAGLRRAEEYRYQAYAALAIGAVLAADAFVADALRIADLHVWTGLLSFIVLAYGFAARLARHARLASRNADLAAAAAVASTIGTTFLAILEWHVTPPHALGTVWAATAAVLTAFGAWRTSSVFRWHGYVLGIGTAFLTLPPLLANVVDTRQEYAATLGVIVFLYLTGYVGCRAAPATDDAERSTAGSVALAGSVLQTLFVWRVVPPEAVALVWSASAVALVTMGTLRSRAGQRWQGYALAALAGHNTYVAVLLGDPTSPRAQSALLVAGLIYSVAYLSRRWQGRAGEVNAAEGIAAIGLSIVPTVLIVGAEAKLLTPPLTYLVWIVTAVGLATAGVWRRVADLRWQAFALFALSALSILAGLRQTEPTDPSGLLWLGLSIFVIYATGLALRSRLARPAAPGPDYEEAARLGLLVAATVLLSVFIVDELAAGLVTLAWALQGATLLVVGFVARERVVRLSGLGLLFLCILKLFVYDLQQLEALARILSFVVLGLVLLSVSWVYTRYREQIRKLL